MKSSNPARSAGLACDHNGAAYLPTMPANVILSATASWGISTYFQGLPDEKDEQQDVESADLPPHHCDAPAIACFAAVGRVVLIRIRSSAIATSGIANV